MDSGRTLGVVEGLARATGDSNWWIRESGTKSLEKGSLSDACERRYVIELIRFLSQNLR